MVQLAPTASRGRPVFQPAQQLPSRHRCKQLGELVLWPQETERQAVLDLQEAREFVELPRWQMWPEARACTDDPKVIPPTEPRADCASPDSHVPRLLSVTAAELN